MIPATGFLLMCYLPFRDVSWVAPGRGGCYRDRVSRHARILITCRYFDRADDVFLVGALKLIEVNNRNVAALLILAVFSHTTGTLKLSVHIELKEIRRHYEQNRK